MKYKVLFVGICWAISIYFSIKTYKRNEMAVYYKGAIAGMYYMKSDEKDFQKFLAHYAPEYMDEEKK